MTPRDNSMTWDDPIQQHHVSRFQVVLSPSESGHFIIKEGGWTDATITFSLATEEGAKWARVVSEEETADMKVVSIDTGGGAVPMPGGKGTVGAPWTTI